MVASEVIVESRPPGRLIDSASLNIAPQIRRSGPRTGLYSPKTSGELGVPFQPVGRYGQVREGFAQRLHFYLAYGGSELILLSVTEGGYVTKPPDLVQGLAARKNLQRRGKTKETGVTSAQILR